MAERRITRGERPDLLQSGAPDMGCDGVTDKSASGPSVGFAQS